jgi:hypothetical protein
MWVTELVLSYEDDMPETPMSGEHEETESNETDEL